MGRGPERPIFVPKGEGIRILLEGGGLWRITNLPSSSFRLEQRPPDTREAQKANLEATFPDIFYPHVFARLDQHGYKVLGGEVESGEMTLMETRNSLVDWLKQAKKLGISNREIISLSKQLLGNITIASSRMGEISPLIKGINTEIVELVDEVWGVKKPPILRKPR